MIIMFWRLQYMESSDPRDILNPSQLAVHDAAIDFFFDKTQQVFEYSGGPGRGKTFVLNQILKSLGLATYQIAPMTFTGSAAINMRRKGMSTAKTIHSWLFEAYEVPLQDKFGNIVYDNKLNRPLMTKKFRPKPLPKEVELCVVDEGGSAPFNATKQILAQNRKVIVTGDVDQLPPVGAPRGFFTHPESVMRLDANMRQLSGYNGIEFLAQAALQGMPMHCGVYGNNAMVIPRSKLSKELLLWADVVICNKNATRDKITKIFRNMLGFKGILPQHGEPILCKQNNWDIELDGINLVNGLRGRVVNYPDVSGIDYQAGTFTVDFLADNMDHPFEHQPVDMEYFSADYETRKKIKDYDLTYTKGELFEFGYAITSYAAQGSEYPRVVYIKEPMSRHLNNTLDYVAITRATDFLTVVLNEG